MRDLTTEELAEVFREIAAGTAVKRSRHELISGGIDRTDLFLRILAESGFHPVTVEAVGIRPGERTPAFHVQNGTALFGWVFWEKFSQLRLRKLFGTVVRKPNGDWLVQVPAHSTAVIYADTSQILPMDIDRPFEL
ncbi:MAG: hypothetical protein HUU02_07235 [Bacteroidetes bacterium]|nr:hypothetical protein [Bacteroidota bacterium]